MTMVIVGGGPTGVELAGALAELRAHVLPKDFPGLDLSQTRILLVEGADVAGQDPVQLRRRIGYVFQGVGLFPHLRVGENVAITPRLLKWPEADVAALA